MTAIILTVIVGMRDERNCADLDAIGWSLSPEKVAKLDKASD